MTKKSKSKIILFENKKVYHTPCRPLPSDLRRIGIRNSAELFLGYNLQIYNYYKDYDLRILVVELNASPCLIVRILR